MTFYTEKFRFLVAEMKKFKTFFFLFIFSLKSDNVRACLRTPARGGPPTTGGEPLL